MASINLPTATKQDAIKTTVDGIDTKSTTINTNLNTANTKLDTLLGGRSVKSIQRGKVTFNDTSTLSQKIIINVVNPLKCVVILKDSSSHSNNDIYGLTTAYAFIDTASFSISRNNNQSTGTTDWQIIEFY